MTRPTTARLAGFTLLCYIVIGVTQMIVFGDATAGATTAERLASMAQHATDIRINLVLGLVTSFVALALGVALYAITRDQDPELALLALACRIGEAVVGGMFTPLTLGLLSVATDSNLSDAVTSPVVTLILTARSWAPIVAAMFFAVGSTLFCWLLLRGRTIPMALAWLGVIASVVLMFGLPLQVAGALRGAVAQLMWLPMAAFEIPLGMWFLIKGAASPSAIHRAEAPASLSHKKSTQ